MTGADILAALERDGILTVLICGEHVYDGFHTCSGCGQPVIRTNSGRWVYYRPETNPVFTIEANPRHRIVHRRETGEGARS